MRQAVDLAVYATIMQGAKKGIWHFADPRKGRMLLDDYIAREATTPVQLTSIIPKREG